MYVQSWTSSCVLSNAWVCYAQSRSVRRVLVNLYSIISSALSHVIKPDFLIFLCVCSRHCCIYYLRSLHSLSVFFLLIFFFSVLMLKKNKLYFYLSKDRSACRPVFSWKNSLSLSSRIMRFKLIIDKYLSFVYVYLSLNDN